MDPIDFIKAPALATPIDWSNSDDLVGVLRDRMKTFSQALDDLGSQWLENKADLQSSVESGIEKLLNTLMLFLNGDIGKAYDEFELGIKYFRGAVDKWTDDEKGSTKRRGQDSLRRGWGWLNSVDAPPETRRREECDLPCFEPWQWTIGHFPQGRRLRSV